MEHLDVGPLKAARGTVKLATITLIADVAGDLIVSLEGLTFVDASGAVVNVRLRRSAGR